MTDLQKLHSQFSDSQLNEMRELLQSVPDEFIISQTIGTLMEHSELTLEMIEMHRKDLYKEFKKTEPSMAKYLKSPITKGELMITTLVFISDFKDKGKDSQLHSMIPELRKDPNTLYLTLLSMITKFIRKEGLDTSQISNFLS